MNRKNAATILLQDSVPHGCGDEPAKLVGDIMPHSRAMGGGLLELRMKALGGTGRVFYCTVVGQTIVMLHTFLKKTQKVPAQELAVARRRMKEIRADAHA